MAFVLRSARYIAEECMRSLIEEGDTVIDATVGNGHDTCTLASLVGDSGHVYGFDIQKDAIDSATERLKSKNLLSRCSLFCAGHQDMNLYIKFPVKAVFFNLGWLPGGNKQITTLWPTTEIAIRAAMKLVVPMGVVCICAYPGHDEGNHERNELIQWFSSLDPRDFNVLEHKFINAGPGAPECFLLQKQK